MTQEELYQGLEGLYTTASATEACYKADSDNLFNKNDLLFPDTDNSKISSEGKATITTGAGVAALAFGSLFAFPFATVAGAAAAAYGGASLAIEKISTKLSEKADNKAHYAEEVSSAIAYAMSTIADGKVNPEGYETIDSVLNACHEVKVQDYLAAGGDPECAPKNIDLNKFNTLSLKAHAKHPDLFKEASANAVEIFSDYRNMVDGISAEADVEM